jgi:F0F1-type ATP synthase assembly protein I
LPPLTPIVRYGRYGAVAFEFAGAIGAGAFFGWLIDAWLETAPWALVACSVLAVVGGFVRLVQVVKRFERHDARRQP